MIYKIYLITDCHNKNYVGVTKLTLKRRLQLHKRDEKKKNCSSYKLNLDDCKIELLEECTEEDSKERERYWINNIDCVNINKLNYDKNQYRERKEYQKEYFKNNREKITERKKLSQHKYYDADKKKKRYRASFGGNEKTHNNLLLIDIDLFK